MEIKEAVQAAMTFAASTLGPERTEGIRLEEIETSIVEGKPVWLITLSVAAMPAIGSFAAMLGGGNERDYRVFTVTKDAGEILAMKIRLFARPVA